MGRSVCAIALFLMFRLLAIQEHFDAVRSSECGHCSLSSMFMVLAQTAPGRGLDVHTSLDVFGDLYKAHADLPFLSHPWTLVHESCGLGVERPGSARSGWGSGNSSLNSFDRSCEASPV
jgi:hypothetical protein